MYGCQGALGAGRDVEGIRGSWGQKGCRGVQDIRGHWG